MARRKDGRPRSLPLATNTGNDKPLDPLPWRAQWPNLRRYASSYSDGQTVTDFVPRDGYEQDRSKYP